jgi:segregation and condensation protein B
MVTNEGAVAIGPARDSGFVQAVRIVEAVLFSATKPVSLLELRQYVDQHVDIGEVVETIRRDYASRGVILEYVDHHVAFRTAPDLGFLLRQEREKLVKLSKAALETLAIIAYHQPVTRVEIEEVRGVTMSRGTLDVLLQTGFVEPSSRRDTPGRPLTFVTTTSFLDHFGLASLGDLPGLQDLKDAGLLDDVDFAGRSQTELKFPEVDA